MKKKGLIALMMSTFVLASTLVGCGSKPQQATNAKKDLKGTTLKIVAAISGKEKIFKEFENETGIKVEFLDISSGEVLAKARADKNKAVADVWFGGGGDSYIAAKKDGLLEAYISEQSKTIPDKFKDKEGSWTAMTLQTGGLVVNKNVAKEKNLKIPETWAELTDPKYKGEILMPNPAVSGTSFCFIAGMMGTLGKDKGWEYFNKLNTNVAYYPQRGGDPLKKAYAGETAIGIAAVDGESLKEGANFPVQFVFPKDGVAWTPSPVAIFKGTKNMDGAKAFVDWALSKKGQQIIANNSGRMGTRPDVEVPEILKDMKNSKLIEYDAIAAGKEREGLLNEWKQKIKK